MEPECESLREYLGLDRASISCSRVLSAGSVKKYLSTKINSLGPLLEKNKKRQKRILLSLNRKFLSSLRLIINVSKGNH